MHLQGLLYHFRWLHAPAAVLMMLLQRTPVLRLVTGGTVNNVGLQSGELLKSAFALTALGAYNSVAGATTFTASVVSPTTVTPASGGANTSFAAGGAQNAAFKITFVGTGAPSTIKSWKVAGTTFPPGLSVTGGTATTGGYTINGLSVPIAGTPTTAGSYPLTINAYDSTGATGNTAKVTCTITITGTTSAQTITFGALANKTYGDAPFIVSATASSGLTPTFSIVSGPATISVSTVTLTGAGTVVVRASQSGNATYSAAAPVDQSFSVAQAAQTITFGALSSKTFGDAPFTVGATASSGLPPTFSIVSGPATISGNTVTITGTGTVVVRASQAGNTNYSAATPVDQSFSVAQATQMITFGALSSKAFGDAPFTVSATASSGLPPTFSIVSGPATISGNTVTITGTGTVVVRASQTGNTNYSAATLVDQSFSVNQTAQTITFGALASKTYGDAPFTVSATATSGLTPTFSIVSGPATISGSIVTITGVGTVVVRASQAGNANYGAATPVDQSFSVSKAVATVTLGSLSQSYTGSALSATASTTPSSLTVTFTYNASATAPINAGSYAVFGTISDSIYQGSASGTLVISPISQTITFGALASKTYGDAPFTVSATATSGLKPTFSIVSGPATISGSTVTLTGAGIVVVRASQAGNNNYSAATPVDQSFSVAQATQTITFGALSSKAYGDAPFIVSATTSSGLTPAFSIVSGPATISGSTVTITGTGTVVVRASQAGNANYSAATPVDQSFSVALNSQTITFGTLASKTYSDAPFTVSATSTSGLTPTFSIVSGPATVTDSTVTITGVGTVVVRASQAGDANYAAANPVDQSFSVSKATATVTLGNLAQSYTGSALSATASTTPSSLTVTFTYNASATAPTNAGNYAVVGTVSDSLYQGSASGTLVISPLSQTITFGALASKTYGDAPFTVNATASSGLSPTFSVVSGPATISGSTVTLTGVGTVVVRASQAGNTNYSAATPVDQSFSVSQASQTITFGALASKTYGDAPFTVSAIASSGLSPTFSIVSGPATISGSTVTITGGGTVIVRASQAGNANYSAATPVDQSFSVSQAAQTITFGPLPSKAFGDASFTVSATASSGLSPTFFIVSGPATISGSTVTITGTGTVVVRASQAGNANYSAATPVDQSFSVALNSQTITFGSLSSKTYGDAPFTISATASSGLSPIFSIVSGPATISGSLVTITGVGTVVVRASQAGNSNYGAATPVDQSFSVSKATATVTLGSLSQFYTGSPLSATASTRPNGLTVTFTYNASATPPTNAGSYAVVGTVNDTLYQGSANGTLVISQVVQTITFGALASKTYGDAPFTVSATASSGLSPTFSIVSGPATISSSTVTITGGGTVIVRASQAGNANYAAATPVDQSFSVSTVPAFTTQPSSQTTFVGSNITFTAVATGVPTPTLQWYKDGSPLFGQTGATLSLANVQSGDAGSYTVTATNSAAPAGVSSAAANLTVSVAPTSPVITVQPVTATTAFIGSSVTLSVQAIGIPTPSYQWKRAGINLPGQTGAFLTLDNVQLVNAGVYTVLVTNTTAPKGVLSKNSTLTVAVPPPAVVTTQSNYTSDTVALDLTGGATYPTGIKFFSSGLPAGLLLNSVTGQITGQITAAVGTYKITYWTQSGTTRSTVNTLTIIVLPFPVALTGSFETLIDNTSINAPAPLPIGKVELKVTSTGAFTGRLITGDPSAYTLRGNLVRSNDTTHADTTLNVVRTKSLNAPNYQLAISVSDAGTLAATLVTSAGQLGSGTGAKLLGSAPAKTYTMTMRNPVNLGSLPAYPEGDAYFSVTGADTGTFSLMGKTSDGTSVTATASVGVDNIIRLYNKSYGTSSGYLAGSLKLTPRDDNAALRHITAANGSDLYCYKSAIANSNTYASGFGPIALEATMEPWDRTAATLKSHLGLAPTDIISANTISSHLDSIDVSPPAALNLSATNVLTVSGENPAGWVMQLNTTTGVFKGSSPASRSENGQVTTIGGVLIQPAPGDTLIGGGYLVQPAGKSSNQILDGAFELAAP